MKQPPNDCSLCFRGLDNNSTKIGDVYDYTIFGQIQSVEKLSGWEGASVNWDIDSGALNEILTRRKTNGEIQFIKGAVKFKREDIDEAIGRYGSNKLGYELREEENNQYHGHILFSSDLKGHQKKSIQAALAYNAIECCCD